MRKKQGAIKLFIPLIAILILSGTAYPITLPTFEILPSINGMSSAPSHLAVSPDGKIYVVENSSNRVAMYTRNGDFIGNIYIGSPTSIAINNNGTIYIGTKKDLSVRIYDSSGIDTGRRLGIGAKEFKLPQSIYIDPSSNNVYVVDTPDDSIKVYSETGTFIKEIDDAPNAPRGVTIYNEEIYVIDSPILADVNGKYRGAGVNVFDMSGNPARSFSSYGVDIGQIKSPAGITNDSEGRIYVTDAYQGVVLCFYGPTGEYLGAIYDPSKPMVTPVGVIVSHDSRLIVASQNTYSLKIFGLEGYTFMTVSPTSLSFTSKEGTNPLPQTVTVSNSGTGNLTYTATVSDNWTVLPNASDTIAAKGSAEVSVTIAATSLIAGTYKGFITVTDNSGSQEKIDVTLEIMKSPKLNVTPGILNYSYNIGSPDPSPQDVTIKVTDDTAGTTSWNATTDKSWLSITPITATGNSVTNASLSIYLAGLSVGPYTGKVTITANGAMGSPAEITVNLTVEPAGSIKVTTNLAEAGFDITGPVNLTGTGTSWVVNNVTDGIYTLTYKPVTGYKSPPSETKTITGGSTIEFTGTYIDLRKADNILVSPGYNSTAPATIRIFSPDGKKQKEITPFDGLSKYGFNLAVGDVDGDGVKDIITGLGSDSTYRARVAVYNREGVLIPGADFIALGTKYGAKVAAGDFDGDGEAEIIVGSGPGKVNNAQVKVFKYDNGIVKNTGVNIVAFSTKYGVNIAAGDIDGDGIDELIVAPGPDPTANATVKILKIDVSGGIGNWKAVDSGSFTAFTGSYGSNIATGDLNGDDIAEIIVSSGSHPGVTNNRITAFYGNGKPFGLDIVEGTSGGLEIGAGDIDMDGIAEIVTALGPKSSNTSLITIYNNVETILTSFTAFNNSSFGAKVSLGDLGY